MSPRNHHPTTRDRLGIAVGLALVCAACLCMSYWPVHMGLTLSSDSIFYLNAAVQLSSLQDWSQLSAQWPPGYPFLINLFLEIAPWPGTAAALLNGFCLTAAALITWYTCFKITEQPLLSTALAMLYVASAVTYWVLRFAWSENLYALFIALHILFVWLDIRRPSLAYFAIAALCGLFAFLTRYVGICTLASGAVFTVWAHIAWREHRVTAGFIRRMTVLFASLGLASIYPIYNFSRGVRVFGPHGNEFGKMPLAEIFDELLFCSGRMIESLLAGSGITVAWILIALALIFILTRILKHRPIEISGEENDSRKRAHFLVYLMILIGIYYAIVITQLVTLGEDREKIDYYRSFRHLASSSALLPVVLAILLRWIATFEPIAKQGPRLVAAASAVILLSGSLAFVKYSTMLKQPEEGEKFWMYGSELQDSLDEIRSFIIRAADEKQVVHITLGMIGENKGFRAKRSRSLLYRQRFLSGGSDLPHEFKEVNTRGLVLELSAGGTRYRIEHHDPIFRGFDSPEALADHVGRIMSGNEIESIILFTDDAGDDGRLAEVWGERRLRKTDGIQVGELHWIRLQRIATL